MIIHLSKFGTVLISRPSGREAYLATKAYLLSNPVDNVEIDFSLVKVVAPSWLDEFLTPLYKEYRDKIKLKESDNQTVKASLATIRDGGSGAFREV